MKITIPENQSEITLSQFQKYDKLIKREDINDFEKAKRVVSLFTGMKYHQVGQMEQKDYIDVISQVAIALAKECEFVDRFELNGAKYGFINLDKMTTAEWMDLQENGEGSDNLHKVMAILFRKIKKETKHGYRVVDYNGTAATRDLMKQLPMNIVNGCLGFFLSLQKELQHHILKCITQADQKEVLLDTLKNGDGIAPYTASQKENPGNLSTS